jgi:hypothetical protein
VLVAPRNILSQACVRRFVTAPSATPSPPRPTNSTRSATTGSTRLNGPAPNSSNSPGSTTGPWKRYIDAAELLAPQSSILAPSTATVRYPRTVPRDEDSAKHLKKRTLTNLYNDRPTWLDLAHKKLDEAVFGAYNWDPTISDDNLLAALLALNLERAQM